DPRHDVRDEPLLEGAVTPRALLERQPVVPPGRGVPRVDAVHLDPSVLDQVGDRRDHPRPLPLVPVAALGGKDEQRASVRAVRENPVPVLSSHVAARRTSSARWGWSESRQETQLWASGCSTSGACQPRRRSALATARLLPRFSSAVPQVKVTGIPSTSPLPPKTRETKRVMRANRGVPASCGSSRRRKKLPDWRNRPPNAPACVQCACSSARAPRLAPRPIGRPANGPSWGSHSSRSTRAYRADAE